MSSKINALRSAATSARRDATANEGHVNYDVSDVSVEAIGSRTMGSGCATVGYCACDDAKNRSRFFRGSTRRHKHDTHRTNARVGTGRVGRGLGKGERVLLALGTASCLVEETTCQRDGNFIIVTSFLVAGGSIFTPWERQTPSFCDVVARASDTPVRQRRQNRKRNLASWRKISHRGQFRLRWCSTKLAREGGGVFWFASE
jgi:hypothetical protein